MHNVHTVTVSDIPMFECDGHSATTTINVVAIASTPNGSLVLSNVLPGALVRLWQRVTLGWKWKRL